MILYQVGRWALREHPKTHIVMAGRVCDWKTWRRIGRPVSYEVKTFVSPSGPGFTAQRGMTPSARVDEAFFLVF